MKQYILKDGTEIQAIPIGRSSVKIGEKSPEGMLIVCDRGPNNSKNRGAMVICQCKCGNYTLISLYRQSCFQRFSVSVFGSNRCFLYH